MDDPLLHLPPSAAAATSSSRTILTRLTTITIIAFLSFWANLEASKGFTITVLPSTSTSFPSRHFNLMYVSNGRAARLLHTSSHSIERLLFPDDTFPRKPVIHITLQLATHELPSTVMVGREETTGHYLITISPSIVSAPEAVAEAVHRGVARVWLWDGEGVAPSEVVHGLVEYLVAAAGYNRTRVSFVDYCEERVPGFVARLNRVMMERWSNVLGLRSRLGCDRFRPPPPADGNLLGQLAESSSL